MILTRQEETITLLHRCEWIYGWTTNTILILTRNRWDRNTFVNFDHRSTFHSVSMLYITIYRYSMSTYFNMLHVDISFQQSLFVS